MAEQHEAITATNAHTILSTLLADQAVLQQQVEAMDSFDDGFDDLSKEMDNKIALLNWQLPELMDYARSCSGSEAHELWSQIVPATENVLMLVSQFTEKMQLANALRGRGVDI